MKVIRQQDDDGCIPACARTVIKELGDEPPDERPLLAAMLIERGSDFERLQRAIASLGIPWEVDVFEAAATEEQVRQAATNGKLPLVAIDPARLTGPPGDKGHCIVITRYDVGGASWRALDPLPGQPEDEFFLDAVKFSKMWCGGFAIVRRRA